MFKDSEISELVNNFLLDVAQFALSSDMWKFRSQTALVSSRIEKGEAPISFRIILCEGKQVLSFMVSLSVFLGKIKKGANHYPPTYAELGIV